MRQPKMSISYKKLLPAIGMIAKSREITFHFNRNVKNLLGTQTYNIVRRLTRYYSFAAIFHYTIRNAAYVFLGNAIAIFASQYKNRNI